MFSRSLLACLVLVTSAAFGLGGGPPVASAAVRYAAPGGTGSDPCANPAKPCSVYTAAAERAPHSTLRAGDVVELAPGTYHAEEEGEFGYIPPVSLPEGVTVRGEPGKARPVIVVAKERDSYSSFYVPTGAEVADVEIRNRKETNGSAIEISGGTIERVIARSVGDSAIACRFDSGTVRDSACINSGGGAAIGNNNLATKGTLTGVIRNSTLIATGPGSVGMNLSFSAFKRGLSVNVDAVAVIVKGEETDVVAEARPLNKGRGADVNVELRASDYATVAASAEQGGTVSVTRPSTNGNVTALPLLSRGNLFQLPGSPTIDRGEVDPTSGPLDVEGEPRTIGAAPDIGADEFGSAPPAGNPAPDTTMDFGPGFGLWQGRTANRVAELTFGSSELGSRYECKLDRGPYRACVSPYAKRVAVGDHRFQVRAVDPEGQTDPSPAGFTWRLLSRRETRRWIRSLEGRRERAAPSAGAARRWPDGRS